MGEQSAGVRQGGDRLPVQRWVRWASPHQAKRKAENGKEGERGPVTQPQKEKKSVLRAPPRGLDWDWGTAGDRPQGLGRGNKNSGKQGFKKATRD